MKNFFSYDYLLDYNYLDSPVQFGDVMLYQVGKKFCVPGADIGHHTHLKWFELTVATEGAGVIFANGKGANISAGEIFLSYPCEIHGIVSADDQPLKYSFFAFYTENAVYKDELDRIMQNFGDCEKRVFKNSSVAYLLDSVISELSEKEFEASVMIESLLKQLIILTVREFLHAPVIIAAHTDKNEILCHKIMRYIDGNIFSLRSLGEAADYFHYNYAYLAKVFAKTTNITLKQYLSAQKLERAKMLIKENKLSFTEIAELLNYASLYSFSKSFKFRFGISPAQYKKQTANTSLPQEF